MINFCYISVQISVSWHWRPQWEKKEEERLFHRRRTRRVVGASFPPLLNLENHLENPQRHVQDLGSKKASFCGPRLWICLPLVAAKIKPASMGTLSLQPFCFVLRTCAIGINQRDSCELFRTPQVSVWTWHFQLQLRRHTLRDALGLLWCGLSRNNHTRTSASLWDQRHTSGNSSHLLSCLAEEESLSRKVCVTDSKHSLRCLLFIEIFFAFHSARELEIGRNMPLPLKLKQNPKWHGASKLPDYCTATGKPEANTQWVSSAHRKQQHPQWLTLCLQDVWKVGRGRLS